MVADLTLDKHMLARMRIRELAHARPRFGFLRVSVLLRREGWPVNKKRVRRLYRLEALPGSHTALPAEP